MSCSGTIGRTALVHQNHAPGVINQALLLVRPNTEITSDMLVCLMQSEYFQEQVFSGVAGSAMKNVASVRELNQILIPVPDLDAQTRFLAEVTKKTPLTSELVAMSSARNVASSALSSKILESAFKGEL